MKQSNYNKMVYTIDNLRKHLLLVIDERDLGRAMEYLDELRFCLWDEGLEAVKEKPKKIDQKFLDEIFGV